MFDVGTVENVARAEEIRQAQANALDEAEGADLGFDMEPDPDSGPGALWISSDGRGEPEHVIAFVLACADAFDLRGRWGFTWALTCSKPRLDGFGGGAQLLDLGARKSVAWTGLRALARRSARSGDRPRRGRRSSADRAILRIQPDSPASRRASSFS